MSRFFFALMPEQKTIDELNQVVRFIKPITKEKVVGNEKLHLTLRYMGPVTDEIIGSIIDSIERVQISSFTLRLVKFEYWEKAEVTVLVPDNIPNELTELFETLEQICVGNGLSNESRSFKPHVTVIKKSLLHNSKNKPGMIFWKINDFVLLHSQTIKGILTYTEIGRWNLCK